MTAMDWTVWVGYELVIATVVYTKTIVWFRRGAVRDRPRAAQSSRAGAGLRAGWATDTRSGSSAGGSRSRARTA